MMHAGTLKFRGASQLSTQIVKVSSIKPESAQQGSNRLIRMQVTNGEVANGRMESRHIIGKQGCPRKSQPLCTSSKQPNSMGSKVTSATWSASALTISWKKQQQHELVSNGMMKGLPGIIRQVYAPLGSHNSLRPTSFEKSAELRALKLTWFLHINSGFDKQD